MIATLVLCTAAQAYRVAIFDFDDRLQAPHTVARYIEKRLTEQIGDIQVEQFSGKGNEALSVDILSSLDRQGYDLIVSVTSDALIIALHTVMQTPLLYTDVNNPLFLGFRTLGPPGGNISGASYYVPIVRQLSAFRTLQPTLKRPGFLFDRFNKSRKVELPESRDACRQLGLEFEFSLVAGKDELRRGVKKLIARGVDAVVATSSGTIYENIAQFVDICNDANIPIYSFNEKGVANGAVAALASDFYRMADALLVPMALKALEQGVSPGQMPAAFLKVNRLIVNHRQIHNLGLVTPPGSVDAFSPDRDPY